MQQIVQSDISLPSASITVSVLYLLHDLGLTLSRPPSGKARIMQHPRHQQHIIHISPSTTDSDTPTQLSRVCLSCTQHAARSLVCGNPKIIAAERFCPCKAIFISQVGHLLGTDETSSSCQTDRLCAFPAQSFYQLSQTCYEIDDLVLLTSVARASA